MKVLGYDWLTDHGLNIYSSEQLEMYFVLLRVEKFLICNNFAFGPFGTFCIYLVHDKPICQTR